MTSVQWAQILLSLFCQTSLLILVSLYTENLATSSRSRVRIWASCCTGGFLLLAMGLSLPRLQLVNPWTGLGPETIVEIVWSQHFLGIGLITIWLLGMFVMICHWLVGHFRLRQLLRCCRALDAEQMAKVSSLVYPSLLSVGSRKIEIVVGPEHVGAFCYQLHKPIIMLPESLFKADPVDLRNVFLHELTHLQSRHAMQLFIEQVLLVVLWFQPLMWIARRHASLAREFECDDATSPDRSATIAYLNTLIRLAERQPQSHRSVLSINRTPGQLTIRVARLVRRDAVLQRKNTAWLACVPTAMAIILSQFWLPINPLASPSSRWSAWPSWSASLLHEFNISARDFEHFDPDSQLHELLIASQRIAD